MPQSLAEQLEAISMTPVLATTLGRTMEYAGAQGHRLITLEHLLLALTEDEEALTVLHGCNVDLEGLRNDISGYLGQLGGRAPPGDTIDPVAGPELTRIMEYAAAAAQQGRRRYVDGAITLAALIGEGQSMAASFLRARGLTFDAAVRVLQQQARSGAPPSPAPAHNGAALPSTEEILATARERVAATRTHGPRPRPVPERTPEALRRPPTEESLAASRARPAAGVSNGPDQQKRSGETAPVLEPRKEAPANGGAVTSDAPEGQDLRRVGVGSGAPPRATTSEKRSADLARDWTPPPLPELEKQGPPQSSSGEPITTTDGAKPVENGPPPLPRWMAKPPGTPRSEQPATGNGSPAPPPSRSQIEDSIRTLETLDTGAKGVGTGMHSTRPGGLPGLRASPAVEPGQLVENIPRRMRVRTSEIVEVRIAREPATGAMSGLQGRGTPVRHDLYITKAMSVRLRAPAGGFKIEASSPETQWTEATIGPLSGEFAVWRFLVTPERRGENELQLIVAARVVGADGVMAETTLPDRVINVRVRANYARTALRWSGWIAAVGVGGAIGKLGEDALATAIGFVNRWTGS